MKVRMPMKYCLTLSAAFLAASSSLAAAEDWNAVLEKAKGQTVYWNAWGGDERTNAFISWVGEQTEALYGVKVSQVKLSSTSDAVNRVIAEKEAGKTEGGSVDLIWINGPNFLSMKEKGLLFGPFAQSLPNAKFLDLTPASANSVDFTVPVEGYESAWRLAKFVFNYDSARVEEPPKSMPALLDWARAHPGRFTHPSVSDFMGATFLKQALIELAPDPSVLQSPVSDADFEKTVAPLWTWYDALKPNLWHGGNDFPENEAALRQLLNDGEVDIALSFDPASAAAAVEQGSLPESVRTYALDGGTIGNFSFVAIPFNAANKEGAQVVANFLIDPATQAHMQDIRVLGSFSVLDWAKLDAESRQAFEGLPKSPSLPEIKDLGKTLLEPHPSWMTRLSEEWAKRYTK
ncbi:ABC transporter substrate-binding protein [Rhizobium sp. L1K21]|uniref:ABC transporter substrate-binding protein n=1 Tax=Rhizobium sp. L1K21 TaxID=2954933 RepID=UPI002092950C|nr:ABC transporter substrate-binding protein [Rhizobium sp. L1K21]MCO6184753.1 ABC transporter substrate-binding protein [Rhizobium sp. L1K21]